MPLVGLVVIGVGSASVVHKLNSVEHSDCRELGTVDEISLLADDATSVTPFGVGADAISSGLTSRSFVRCVQDLLGFC